MGLCVWWGAAKVIRELNTTTFTKRTQNPASLGLGTTAQWKGKIPRNPDCFNTLSSAPDWTLPSRVLDKDTELRFLLLSYPVV